MEKNRSFGKTLVVIILVLAILGGIGWVVYTKFFKDKNKGVTGTEVELAAYAINKTNEKNGIIANNYAKSSSRNNLATASLLANNAMYAGTSTYADEALSLEDVDSYFGSLVQCYVVPAAIDYIVNSSTTSAYANTFELDRTYFSREVIRSSDSESPDQVNIYYFKVTKVGSIVDCFLEYSEQQIICQIEYDFENDTLISAKTVAPGIFAFVDYSNNEFSFTSFSTNKSLQDIMDGKVSYTDIANSEYNYMYKGNIVNNINSIEFQEIKLDSSEGNDTLFNAYISKFALGIDLDNIFDKKNMTQNNSFIDAMEYSTNRIDYVVRVNPNNPFEYQYITKWVEYEDMLSFLNAVVDAEELADSALSRSLVTAYKNRLEQRGKGAYTGDNSFSHTNSYLKISKVYDELDAYIISIVTDDGPIEFCCQYINNEIISKNNEYFTTEFNAIKSPSGHAILTSANTNGIIINIPTEIEVDDELLPVKELGNETMAYFSCYSSGSIILNIPETVESVCFESWFEVAEFNVDAGNTHLKSVDGVLYSADMRTLICYPKLSKTVSYTIPNGVETIEEDAFQGLHSLQTLEVPSSLVDGLETRNFWASFSLQNINVHTGTVYSSHNGIVYNAAGDTLLMCPAGKTGTINIKTGTRTIGEYSFGYCKFVESISIPSSVTTIEDLAFSNCESLKTLNLPDSITSFGGAYGFDFGGTNSLNAINVTPSNTIFSTDNNGLLYNKNKTILYFVPRNFAGEIVIPSTVTKIADYAFDSCTKLTKVTLPSSVTSIGLRAFIYSSASEIIIQGSVSIDYEAFFRSEVEKITINGLSGVNDYNRYAMDWYAIEDCEYLTTIVYNNTMADWQSHVNHNDYSGYYLPQITVKCTDGDITYTPTND